MEELEVTQAEAIERAVRAESHAKLCGVLAWVLLTPNVGIAFTFFNEATQGGLVGDERWNLARLGVSFLILGALLYMTPMMFRHILEMKATSLKLQVDAMPD